MLTPRRVLVLALALMGSALPASSAAASDPPPLVPGKPRPAPPGPSAMPALPPAVIDNNLSIGGDDVKARKVETRMTVDVAVNGRGPYHFLVDSGADTSAVGLRLAKELALPLGTPVVLNAMTDRSIVDRVKVDSIAFGPSTIHDLLIPALREEDVGGDGVIGIDALVKQRLLMDFDKKLIKVEDARAPVHHFTDEIIITARLRHGQLILTQVRAGRISLEAVIDTGSEITIGNMALRDRLLGGGRTKVQTVEATGVTGKTLTLEIAVIPELRLGSVILEDVPIAFANVLPFEVFGLNDGPSMLLGTDILQTFRRVSLDFAARKVRFQLKRCGSVGIFIDTYPDSYSRVSSGAGREVCS